MFEKFSVAGAHFLTPYPGSPWTVCTQSAAQLPQAPTHETPGMEHLQTSPCTQRPAGLTGCLGGRWKCPAKESCKGRWKSLERLDSVGG